MLIKFSTQATHLENFSLSSIVTVIVIYSRIPNNEMDNPTYKELTVFLFLLSFGTTFSASIFGLNLGSLRDTAVNNIEQVPKFLHRVNLFNHHKHHTERNPTTFQDNREIANNERVSFPYANSVKPAKYDDQQNWGLNNPSASQGNIDYNVDKSNFSPSPNQYSSRQESDSNNPISFTDNLGSTDYNEYKNNFNPTTNKQQQGYSFASTTSHFINKVIQENKSNYGGSPVNVNNRGSFYDGVENSKPFLPENYIKKNPVSELTVASNTDFSTDYSTTSDYDWTTTDEPLNRIGDPPALVASILG